MPLPVTAQVTMTLCCPNPGADIAEKWSIAPQELVMIGDSAKDDVSLVAGCCLHSVGLCG